MLAAYKDIRNRLGKPLWWDEVGCPRYESFTPDLLNNIYAEQAVLLLISCQNCGEHFKVAMSWHPWADRRLVGSPLRELVSSGKIHYGDPPNACCTAGAAMNCVNERVLEFWSRDDDWARCPELEIELEA